MRIGLSYPRTLSPSLLPQVAARLDEGGIDELWVIEDCFFTTGPSLAAAALTATERVEVGIGILPAVVRHPAVTAMELATLADLGGGRFTAGIGHGVQRWMQQMGVRPGSPLTALDETITVVKRLLAGEEVTFDGTFRCEAVRLERPPSNRIDVLAGVQGPKSMTLAGRVADGVILTGPLSPQYIRWSREQAAPPGRWRVVGFAPWLVIDDDAYRARSIMSGWLAGELARPNAALRTLPYFEDLRDRFDGGGTDALRDMPVDWWRDLGPIGARRDAHEYLDRAEAAGADSISVFPAPDADLALEDVDALIEFAQGRR